MWAIFGRKSQAREPEEENAQGEEPDLHQWLPPVFAQTLERTIGPDQQPLAVLFVPSDRTLEWRPGRALVLLDDGVLVMEEGESVIINQRWGVKTLFCPYRQVAAVGIGHALLRARFTLYAAGNAPACEIPLHWYDLTSFRAAAALIRERVAALSTS